MASPGKRAFLLRVKPEVLDAVERLAAAELRSVNAQLEVLLREALARRGGVRPKDGEER
ncbi:MAG: Arc family DNA-binding protein [Caulobacter sp.]|nr:Arc family DNA-binding protein [Caulobacter sp.]